MVYTYSVSELCTRIQDRLAGDVRLHDVWARGELSNVVNHSSGHRYFTLKDSEAQISCVMFRAYASDLDFVLRDGMNVRVFGDVGFYKVKGDVQLQVRLISPDTGIGRSVMELEFIRRRLAAEGLFAPERKRQLPRYPERIGIVTSMDGAALRDVVRSLGKYPARIILSPATVQGDAAAQSMISALRALRGRADVIILCRGGGSAEDLSPFNDEHLARAIAECDAPVISAVGHEVDVTIADLVADARASTPTAAAKLAVPDAEEIRLRLRNLEDRMTWAIDSHLERVRSRLDYLGRGIGARQMYAFLERRRIRLRDLSRRLPEAARSIVDSRVRRLEIARARLDSASPLAVLSRGYTMVVGPAGVVCRAADLGRGENITLVFSDGEAYCRVSGIKLRESGREGPD
ncbi:MAG TPA: exodeoxyribonuclease VII large subunit [Methanothrix sp.]|nr:exodeoxyribonuclease VII large subunit [Methanothrix sp.]HOK58471.1 exodeoxyribonuclease VII large subunit [Methanothrix sp.]HOL44100.1 exodeoxyribonuclease VII large subunit [Methanothrix sp.]HPO88792.1 exodeoxyribonuclease VII large subunit [Methanothrix sp.]